MGGFIKKVKQAREFGRQLRRVKEEMKDVEVGVKGPKAKARKLRELVRKLRNTQEEMGKWELGELSREADKEGKELDKLITLAEAKERVANLKVRVSEAKGRLKPKPTTPKTKTKITFRGVTLGRKKTPLPKRKPGRITPKQPKLRR